MSVLEPFPLVARGDPLDRRVIAEPMEFPAPQLISTTREAHTRVLGVCRPLSPLTSTFPPLLSLLRSFMIPLHARPTLRRDPDAQSDMNESVVSTNTLKPPSIQSVARAKVYKWSRRIMITTESLWLKKIRRNKFKTFIFIFLPSAFIFLLAFSLAPPKGYSNSNNLMFFMGGVMTPDITFTAGVIPKRIHSRRDCEFSSHPLLLPAVEITITDKRLWTTASDVRYTPLLAALSYGVTSIEIYLWLDDDGVLYVSHDLPTFA